MPRETKQKLEIPGRNHRPVIYYETPCPRSVFWCKNWDMANINMDLKSTNMRFWSKFGNHNLNRWWVSCGQAQNGVFGVSSCIWPWYIDAASVGIMMTMFGPRNHFENTICKISVCSLWAKLSPGVSWWCRKTHWSICKSDGFHKMLYNNHSANQMGISSV